MKKETQAPVIISVRRKRHQEPHHGGAWKVAFADFMTAMFALFLVLWLINQSSDVKSAIAGYFQDPLGRADEFGNSIIPGEGAQTQMVRPSINIRDVTDPRRDRLQSIAHELKASIQQTPELSRLAGQVSIRLTDEGLQIELLEDSTGCFYERGNGTPTAGGHKILALLGSELGHLPLPVRIDGHTDAHPYPSPEGYTNWELSADRANAARRIMTQNGLSPGQIAQVRAFAEKQPREGADPFSPGNRRVTITMLLGREPAAPATADSTGRSVSR